jgi:hypothetical protein
MRHGNTSDQTLSANKTGIREVIQEVIQEAQRRCGIHRQYYDSIIVFEQPLFKVRSVMLLRAPLLPRQRHVSELLPEITNNPKILRIAQPTYTSTRALDHVCRRSFEVATEAKIYR